MFLYVTRYVRHCIFLISLILVANVAIADSTMGQRFFDDGNAGFRQGNFEVALASYNDALANGKDTPRVYYNMGLAHFRLGQHEQAKSAFLESSRDRELAGLSYYQLGALAEREDKYNEAVNWLRRARDSARSEKLRRQSTKALAVMGVTKPRFESSMSVGFGYDSNAFRSPDEPYIDYSLGVPAPVVPVPQSGAYVPVKINADYYKPLSKRTAFTTGYSMRGEFHTDPELQNADVYDHRLTIGGERRLRISGSTSRKIAVEAFYRMHGETNFDRDDGLDRFDDGESIADRFKYQSIGAEADLRSRLGSMRYTISTGAEMRDYDDLPTASSYDMTNYWIGGDIKFPLSDASRLRLGYEYYARDFDQRHSRDATGDASTSNPTLEYRYHELTAGLKRRFSNGIIAEVTYYYTTRNDEFVNYNSYKRHKIRLATAFDLADRFRANVRLDYRDQNYPNAFAFDDPSQPRKEYQELEAVVGVDYQITDRLSIRADFRQEIVESSDPRGEYDRLRGAIGVHWAYD